MPGDEIRFGAMAPDGGPAPEHTGHDGKPKGVSTNDVLGFIEFGTKHMAERPVIRWVQQTKRREIQHGAARVVRAIAQKKAHVAKLHALGAMLRDATKDRIVSVGAVDAALKSDVSPDVATADDVPMGPDRPRGPGYVNTGWGG